MSLPISIPEEKVFDVNQIVKSLSVIAEKDRVMFGAIRDIIFHVENTYSDKYQSEITKIIDTKNLLTDTKNGKWANFHNAAKYLQRYFTEGFDKSYNRADLLKAIHYILFELVRRKNEADGKI